MDDSIISAAIASVTSPFLTAAAWERDSSTRNGKLFREVWRSPRTSIRTRWTPISPFAAFRNSLGPELWSPMFPDSSLHREISSKDVGDSGSLARHLDRGVSFPA